MAASNVPTLADLLAVNVFELDDWSYEEEEEDSAAVNKTKVCCTKYFLKDLHLNMNTS